MNPVFVILVLLIVLAGGEGDQFGFDMTPLRGGQALLMAFGPPIGLLVLFRVLIGITVHRMASTGRLRTLSSAERAAEGLPWLALINHACASGQAISVGLLGNAAEPSHRPF